MSTQTPTADHHLPASIAEIESLHAEMRGKAREGSWSAFGELLARRNRLLATVSDGDRAVALTLALECNEAVLGHARSDRDTTASRIEAIGRKHAVGSYYRSNGGSGTEL